MRDFIVKWILGGVLLTLLYKLSHLVVQWADPMTWSSALVTVDQLNEQFRNNLEYLFTPPSDVTDYDEGTDKTTTSVSFVAVDTAGGTDLRATLTTSGEDVAVSFSCLVSVNNSGNVVGGVHFNILVDGTTLAVADDGIPGHYTPVATGGDGDYSSVFFRVIVPGLPAATHTFDVMWKAVAPAGTTTVILYSGAGTAGRDLRPQLDARKAA